MQSRQTETAIRGFKIFRTHSFFGPPALLKIIQICQKSNGHCDYLQSDNLM